MAMRSQNLKQTPQKAVNKKPLPTHIPFLFSHLWFLVRRDSQWCEAWKWREEPRETAQTPSPWRSNASNKPPPWEIWKEDNDKGERQWKRIGGECGVEWMNWHYIEKYLWKLDVLYRALLALARLGFSLPSLLWIWHLSQWHMFIYRGKLRAFSVCASRCSVLMKNHPVNPSWFLESENALIFYTEICHKCKSSLCTNDTSNNLQNPRGQFLGIEFQVTNQTLTRVKSLKI